MGLRGRFVIDWGEGKRERFFARFFSSYSNDSVFFLSLGRFAVVMMKFLPSRSGARFVCEFVCGLRGVHALPNGR